MLPHREVMDFLKQRVYYTTSEYAKKLDDDGAPLVMFVTVGSGYFVMHPDNLPTFLRTIEISGSVAVDIRSLAVYEQQTSHIGKE